MPELPEAAPRQAAPKQTAPRQRTPEQVAGYPDLIAKLVAMRETLGHEQAEVLAWYAEQQAAAQAAVERATAAVSEAAAELAAAEQEVARVDFWARRLWGDLGNRLSRGAANRRGPVPAPVREAVRPGDAADRLIGQVRARLAAAPVVQVLHAWAYPLMAVFGAGCAAGLTRLALALPGPVWSRAVLVVAAPLIGLTPAKLLAHAQRCGLDAWSIALTLSTGVLATAAMLALR